jgi:hypothetical protein
MAVAAFTAEGTVFCFLGNIGPLHKFSCENNTPNLLFCSWKNLGYTLLRFGGAHTP